MNAPTTAPAHVVIAHGHEGEPITIDLTSTGTLLQPGANVLIEGEKGTGKTRLLNSIHEAAEWQRVKVYDLGVSWQPEGDLLKAARKILPRDIEPLPDGRVSHRAPRHTVVLIDDYEDTISARRKRVVRHLLDSKHVTVVMATESLRDDSIRGCYPGGSHGYFATSVRLTSRGEALVTRNQTAKAFSI